MGTKSYWKNGTLGFWDDQNNTGYRSGMWADCPMLEALCDPSVASVYVEDFVGNVLLPTATGTAMGWKSSGDSTYDVLTPTGTLNGIIHLAPETGSDNEVYFQMGQLATATYMEYTKNSGLKSWLEYRLAYPSITNAANVFIGLASEGAAAANFIVDDGDDYADVDLVGFVIWEGDPNAIDVNYQITGTGFADGGLAGVPVAGTYLTLGIYFDGVETVSFYKDGAVVQTVDLDTSTFPTGEELSPIIGLKNGAADAAVRIDWIKMVQER